MYKQDSRRTTVLKWLAQFKGRKMMLLAHSHAGFGARPGRAEEEISDSGVTMASLSKFCNAPTNAEDSHSSDIDRCFGFTRAR